MIEVGTERFAEKPPRAPRRVTDPTTRTPIGASPKDLATVIHSAVRVSGEPEQAKVMRRHLRILIGTQRRELPIITSLTSELFNNAIEHSHSGNPGGEITIVVIKMPGRTQVKVLDQGPRPGRETGPRLRPVDLKGTSLSEGGFGLRLVDQEATRWGVVYEKRRTTVWFDVDRSRHRRSPWPGATRTTHHTGEPPPTYSTTSVLNGSCSGAPAHEGSGPSYVVAPTR